jgi:hypothetical protein
MKKFISLLIILFFLTSCSFYPSYTSYLRINNNSNYVIIYNINTCASFEIERNKMQDRIIFIEAPTQEIGITFAPKEIKNIKPIYKIYYIPKNLIYPLNIYISDCTENNNIIQIN